MLKALFSFCIFTSETLTPKNKAFPAQMEDKRESRQTQAWSRHRTCDSLMRWRSRRGEICLLEFSHLVLVMNPFSLSLVRSAPTKTKRVTEAIDWEDHRVTNVNVQENARYSAEHRAKRNKPDSERQG